jgi:HSP20 family molecular chaperone IbpA
MYYPEMGVVELTIELPGVTTKDLAVEIEDDKAFRFYGNRRITKHQDTWILSSFDERFRMKRDSDSSRVKAYLLAGILTVHIPYKKEKVVESSSQYDDE